MTKLYSNQRVIYQKHYCKYCGFSHTFYKKDRNGNES